MYRKTLKAMIQLKLLSDTICLYSQGYVEEKSLYIRTSRIRDKNEKRMEIRLKEENEQESIYLTQLLDNVKIVLVIQG